MDVLLMSLYIIVILVGLYILVFRPDDRRTRDLVLFRDLLDHPLE